MVLALCASAASAAPTGSCRQNSATPSHYDCDFYTAGNGISGGSPVVDAHGTKVGYLNGGTNFVDCQEAGSEYPSAGAAVRNDWWAWTEANNDTWGWVSALFASGGDNDGTFAGVPSCDLQRDAPPSALKSTGPAKAKPSPKPDPTSCTKSGSGTASVTFREYEQKYQQDESPGPGGLGPRYDLEKAGYHTFAGLTIAADTCHGPKGWHLGHTVSVSESSVGLYPGADDSPAVRGSGGTQGWGIAVQSYRNGVLTVQALACAKTTHVSWWSVAKKIVGLIPPIPGTPLIIARAKYVVGLIPVKGNTYTTHCADLGTDRLHLTAVSQQRVGVTSQGYSDVGMGGLFEDHRDHDGTQIRHVIYQRDIQNPIIK